MMDIICDLDTIEPTNMYTVSVSGNSEEELIVNWLQELLYLHEVKRLLFCRFELKINQNKKAEGNCWGEEIDFSRHICKLDGDILDLTTNEFAALALLAGSPGKVFNRDEILQELRGIDCDAFNRSVDITMSRLRQKLKDDPKSPVFIKTVWGTGYVFIGEASGDAKNLAE